MKEFFFLQLTSCMKNTGNISLLQSVTHTVLISLLVKYLYITDVLHSLAIFVTTIRRLLAYPC